MKSAANQAVVDLVYHDINIIKYTISMKTQKVHGSAFPFMAKAELGLRTLHKCELWISCLPTVSRVTVEDPLNMHAFSQPKPNKGSGTSCDGGIIDKNRQRNAYPQS